jgi:ferredoxin-nitrate reductase
MAVLNGTQLLMVKNSWISDDYVSKHVRGRDELYKKDEKYTPELVEKITGIPTKQLMEAAEIIGTTKSLLSTCLQDVYQSN